MTAPLTIRPQRTVTPSGIPVLIDAEIQAANLVYTLDQIRQYGHLDGWRAMELYEALDSAKDAQHHITTLQGMEGR